MTSRLLKQSYQKNLDQQFIIYAVAQCKLRIEQAAQMGAMNYVCNIDEIKNAYGNIVLTNLIINEITSELKQNYPGFVFSTGNNNGICIDWS